MQQINNRQIQLPDMVNLSLPGQYLSVVMQALSDSGPVRVVLPVIQTIEAQLRAAATLPVQPPQAIEALPSTPPVAGSTRTV